MQPRVAAVVAFVVMSVVGVRTAAGQGAQAGPGGCPANAWPEFETRVKAAQARFQQRDAEPLLALWSHADDVTLMGALGGHERGWAAVGARLSRIAGTSNGTHDSDEIIARVLGVDVATWTQLEHITQRNPDGAVRSRNHLRVTHAARCEAGAWRIVHRHADFLVESQLPPQ